MTGFAGGLKRAVRTAAFVVLAAVGILALFVIWWLALLAAAGFIGFWYVRRLMPGRQPPAPGGKTVIEGEYSVESEKPGAGAQALPAERETTPRSEGTVQEERSDSPPPPPVS